MILKGGTVKANTDSSKFGCLESQNYLAGIYSL